MHKFVFHNDRLLPLEQVRLSPGQAGLLNGWGLFTTLRIYDGLPFALERHWERLVRDAARIQLPVPVTLEAARRHVGELLQANQVGTGCLRIYFVYNKIGIWGSKEPFPVTDFLMYTTDLPQRVGPTRLAVQEHGRHAAHPLTGTKTISWLNNVWMVEQAHQRGFEDVILLNERGQVAECTAANVYCVKDGKVATPPLESGCLAGVSREILLEISTPAGLPIREQALTLDELYAADEVFISSTTRQVQPVSHIENRAFSQAPGPLTQRYAKLFSDYVSRYFEQARSREVAAQSSV